MQEESQVRKEIKISHSTGEVKGDVTYSHTVTAICDFQENINELHYLIEDYQNWNKISPYFNRPGPSDKFWKEGPGVLKFSPPGATEPIMLTIQLRPNWVLPFMQSYPSYLPKFEFEFTFRSENLEKNATTLSIAFSYNDEKQIIKICGKNPDEFVKEIMQGVYNRWLTIKRNEIQVIKKTNKDEEISSVFRLLK